MISYDYALQRAYFFVLQPINEDNISHWDRDSNGRSNENVFIFLSCLQLWRNVARSKFRISCRWKTLYENYSSFFTPWTQKLKSGRGKQKLDYVPIIIMKLCLVVKNCWETTAVATTTTYNYSNYRSSSSSSGTQRTTATMFNAI